MMSWLILWALNLSVALLFIKGLERHEGEYLMKKIKIFGRTIPFSALYCSVPINTVHKLFLGYFT